jgi:hypothetical protein
LGFGDELVAAGQAQRLFDEQGKRVLIVDEHGSPRWHPMWAGNPVIVNPNTDPDAGRPWLFTRLRSGPHCRPYIVYPFTQQTGWTFNASFRCRDHLARIYLTDAERQRGIDARARYGPYILIEPFTKHVNFRWALDRWAALVAACQDRLTFLQHTHADSVLVPGARPEPATFREACGLIASADAYVRSESGLCHAAAALGVPQVTIFGGCMDPDVMGGYPGQMVLADRQEGSPCGSWLSCAHCARIMGALAVDEVASALRGVLRARRAA